MKLKKLFFCILPMISTSVLAGVEGETYQDDKNGKTFSDGLYIEYKYAEIKPDVKNPKYQNLLATRKEMSNQNYQEIMGENPPEGYCYIGAIEADSIVMGYFDKAFIDDAIQKLENLEKNYPKTCDRKHRTLLKNNLFVIKKIKTHVYK